MSPSEGLIAGLGGLDLTQRQGDVRGTRGHDHRAAAGLEVLADHGEPEWTARLRSVNSPLVFQAGAAGLECLKWLLEEQPPAGSGLHRSVLFPHRHVGARSSVARLRCRVEQEEQRW